MEERQALTIRVPSQLLAQARRAKAGRESFNDLVVTALEQEVRRRQAFQTHAEITALRERVRARTGVQPDSTPFIRRLREGEERRD